MSSGSPPNRGEVWLINFDPTLGAEIRKTRPAVVVSSDGMGRLPVKLVAPITEWKDAFSNAAWLVRSTRIAKTVCPKPPLPMSCSFAESIFADSCIGSANYRPH